ncbi:MAG: serine/threonine-protein kinase, partial [Planctomycetota bacterium]
MRNKPVAHDPSAFLQAAVAENMLTPASAKDLAQKLRGSDKAPAQLCVDLGRLSAIQADALLGLLSPTEVAAGYEVLGLLGHGAIGIVYRARQPGLDREVALKTIGATRLVGSTGSGTSAVARFKQEAVAIAKLKHPNIVTAYDYGSDGERLFLAMEMVDGVDLESLIQSAGKLDEATAWQLARQVAAALAHAAELGVIHRDIKPANLLLTEPPAGYPLPPGVPLLKVTDFGLARLNTGANEEEATRLTMAGATMGTPHYMAPEQIDDSNVGFQADIYALGATVYHMVAGEPPFAGRSMMKVFAAKMAGEAAPLEGLPEEVSPASHQLLREMLATRPGDRPESYDELLDRIGDLLGDESLETRSATATLFLSDRLRDSAASTGDDLLGEQRPTGGKKTHRRLIAAVATISVLAATVAAVVASRGPSGPPPRVYELNDEAIVPLFDGQSPVGWLGRGVQLGADDHAGTLIIKDEIVTRSIAKSVFSLPDPEHYAIEFSLDLGSAGAFEVWFDEGADGELLCVRITSGAASVGSRMSLEQTFKQRTPPLELANSTGATFFRIERDESQWFAYQTSPDIR